MSDSKRLALVIYNDVTLPDAFRFGRGGGGGGGGGSGDLVRNSVR